jgi:Zn-dependent alcohol dehydrogenase
MGTLMLAAVVHAFGQPPRLEEFPDPTPGDGEVIVQVGAAGLHPVVKALASGAHYGSADQLPKVAGVSGSVGYAVPTAVNGGSKLLIFVPRAGPVKPS